MSTLTAVALLGGCAEALVDPPRPDDRIAFESFDELRIRDLSGPDGAGALYLVGEQAGEPVLLQLDRQDRLRALALFASREEARPVGGAVAVAASGRRLAVAFESGEVYWVGEGLCCRFEPAPLDLAPGPREGFWILTPSGLYLDEAPEEAAAAGGLALVAGAGGGVAVLGPDGVASVGVSGVPPNAVLARPLRTGALLPGGRLYGLEAGPEADPEANPEADPGLVVVDGGRSEVLNAPAALQAVATTAEGVVWVAGSGRIGRVSAGAVRTVLEEEQVPLLDRAFTAMQADGRSLTLTSSASVLRLIFGDRQ